ncbi:MAG: bifunctional 2-C-methyl-D-erythritol 4-phosphate cytidylyltransferase/2-C-methyl-D-erythritol 2,4-cyclodiphosphate synthase [Azospirillum sp.]|nr:bifunctional 2-C-methyl-D-erythritol 4-phosphate cytidylyltransferase/2-C-methyl-D-erythritol 2,4-cyclodiphosphate synthase [Azospirillum sp.]MCA3268606.1 bifunctional 2-C-methyl-D-erythritol 4-phosphate cytidylyltransferase/2-C-methyl-D-erythritol 2,4-cyclodiphosphate synthase [Azospirillum sp.]
MSETIALVLAAGKGKRLPGDVPKQYRDLAGAPVLRRALDAFARHARIDAVRVVFDPADALPYARATEGLALLDPVPGGAERQDSVRRGLESLEARRPARVLIHDGARPFPDERLIDRLIDALDAAPGAIAAIPVVDTLWRAGDDGAETLVPRQGLWRAQTPQAFRYADILAAHRAAAGLKLTDDAAVARHAGLRVSLVMAGEENFKITTESDLSRAARALARTDIRTGTGFDVHKFGPGDGVWLCGVRVPHDATLDGHSDADVGIHALVDALLGAIGAADIGAHFPPTDPRWKGAASDRFLAHAAALVRERGGEIRHVDVTLICERPKVGPHREAMRAALARILDIDVARVSVKATTTEGLGFAGRREGIAAQAAATVALP